MSLAIGCLAVFFGVGDNNMTRRVVAVEGEEGLKSTAKSIGQGDGAEGVVL